MRAHGINAILEAFENRVPTLKDNKNYSCIFSILQPYKTKTMQEN